MQIARDVAGSHDRELEGSWGQVPTFEVLEAYEFQDFFS